MQNNKWVLIDTETTGFSTPIFVVELAAQIMNGWMPQGPPFRRLVNQNQDIPPEASRVHGYTREILERDGEPAAQVYRGFAEYVGGMPLVSFNLEYDLTEVLEPEWKRLGIKPIGTPGFCALRLAQRLLDPVPAGNCKLQTLRQYYKLPERGAHTALGDVQTVADLMANVLQPIAENRGLTTWERICEFAASEWFPSRIAFGKFKGRHFQDALTDKELMGWLHWLTKSTNPRSASMGRWYLTHLNEHGANLINSPLPQDQPVTPDATSRPITEEQGVAIFTDVEIQQLRRLIETARARLAEVEATYTQERQAVNVTQSTIFKLVRAHYQTRDRLRLVVGYRTKYLNALLRGGEEEAEEVTEEYKTASEQSDTDYEQADATAESQKSISDEDAKELDATWKKLVRLYHPDRFANQPDKLETYTLLTMTINKARDEGDIALLREIATDPHGFILKCGWAALDFDDAAEMRSLRRLLDTLQLEIVSTMELLSELRESPEYKLYSLSKENPTLLEEVAAEQRRVIESEISELEAKAEKLKTEIAELTGAEV